MKLLTKASLPQLRRWFWLLLLANILYFAAAHFLLQPFAPEDIVHFEMAKETSVAENIVQAWRLEGNYDRAIVSVYIDFLFILLYTSGLAVACAFLSRLTKHEILRRAGRLFSYLMIIAGICDVVENIAMLKSLNGMIYSWNVMLAYDMAATKFSIIILSILFIIICLIFWGLLWFEGGKK